MPSRTVIRWSPASLQECLNQHDAGQERDLFARARALTECYFARRLLLFAPLYVSNRCVNNCLYCAFRRDNMQLERRTLRIEEIRQEVEALAAQGHRTVLLVAGEHPQHAGSSAIAEAVRVAYSVSGIEDVRVEVMPMSVEGYRLLHAAGASTVVLYQETYDSKTYAAAHPAGSKAVYAWRFSSPDRVLEAGVRRIGLGILVGLGEVAADAVALIAHARAIHEQWGVWPTVSLPRIRPALEAPWALRPPRPVGDDMFVRLIAAIRVALPEAGIVLSTRERPAMRNRLLELGIGVTHLSAGSRTEVGGYVLGGGDGQFTIQDERTVDEVITQVRTFGYTPVWAEPAANAVEMLHD